MEKTENNFTRYATSLKCFPCKKRESISIFDRLPFFQPWVWKLSFILGAISFAVGWGIIEWAKYSLMK